MDPTTPTISRTQAAREMDRFRAHVTTGLGPRARITRDPEGWPMVPGKYGRLEWRGLEWDAGAPRLYVYTARPHFFAKLRAVPGVLPKQIGDREAVFSLRADDGEALRAVARLLQLRSKRPGPPQTSATRAALALANALRASARAKVQRSAGAPGPGPVTGQNPAPG